METRPQAVARQLMPRATFRLLKEQGLTPAEATRLTAFLCGMPATDLRWSLEQLSRMLFLQRLYEQGRFGGLDRDGIPPN